MYPRYRIGPSRAYVGLRADSVGDLRIGRVGLGAGYELRRRYESGSVIGVSTTTREGTEMASKMCNVCGVRRVGSGGQQYDTQAAASNGLCGPCDEEGGWENTHSDYGHEGNPQAEFAEGCWICHPELNMAQQTPTSKAGKPGHNSPRRKQLNHRTQCTHPQTPAARRACREAYWSDNSSTDKDQALNKK